MLMRHRHYQPESPDYYSSLTAASPSLSLGIISSSLEKMPLELRLRKSGALMADEYERAGTLDEELSPKTECSEDSVEIRSTPMRIHRGAIHKPLILRPNAVLAGAHAPLKRACNTNNKDGQDCRNKMSRWNDVEQPEEKRMRLMAGGTHPPLLAPFYHATSVEHQHADGLKLAGHPHDFLLLEAERNRLLHQWMRPDSWPRQAVNHPAVESAAAAHHLMTSAAALHYHYPHLLQPAGGGYSLPPPPPHHHHPFVHPAAAAIFNLSYGHLLPQPMFHHQRPTLFSPPPPPPSVSGVKTPFPTPSPVCARSVTPPPPSMLGPLPALVPLRDTPPPSDCSPPMSNASGQSLPSLEKRTKSKTSKTSDASSSPTSHQPVRMIEREEKKRLLNDSGSNGNRPEEANKSNGAYGVKPSAVPLFLSVETLLRRDKPTDNHPAERPEEEEEEEEETPHHFQLGRVAGRESSSAGSHRNYKNMTRERRMQANARERTRVHTISSAFEALRRAVPSFSHGQRLSKLSILRVASAYIAALGQLAGEGDNETDDELQQHRPVPASNADGRRQLSECVDRCTRTLMTEGQLLRRNRKRSGAAGRQKNATDDEDEPDD
ncbi:hypothetical protein GHT06_015964 [Daphnia sinensis]|uniref:BHLH domain-containing protein n=1 Tax=Daphnia sinensis TaxID=1820382 RepID=A0AAD5LC49_9CRUS|nr:hypothetical protein GHT06_015964 [Daphnia sinensis]